MAAVKNIVQRNLPLSQTYTLLASFYSSIEEGSGHVCENCGRLISNIAQVQGDTDKNIYYIGMDCAGTLTGLKNDFVFEYTTKAAFEAGKQARATILKLLKKGNAAGIAQAVSAQTFQAGEGYYKEQGAGIFRVNSEPFNPSFSTFKQFPAAQWKSHVYPMIKDLLTA